MPRARTIRIFLPNGDPDGLRIIEKGLWTGKALDFPRSEWPSVRSRHEFGRPGVYVLNGIEESDRVSVYIGEADDIRNRINHHYGSLDFWTRAVVFVSKDENLNKAGVRYLEAQLVRLASDAKRATVTNASTPVSPFMSEAETAESDGFLEEMLPIYALVGLSAFEPASRGAEGRATLYLGGKGVRAAGRETPQGFVVFAGATAVVREAPSLYERTRGLRHRLVDAGILVPAGTHMRFTSDYVFDSPSSAASVVLARPTNGRTAWRDDAGTTLREIQEHVAKQSAGPQEES